MRAYAVEGPSATGTADKTAVNIIGGTGARPTISEINFSSPTTPADQEYEFWVGRTTAVGTAASNPTPNPVDPSDVASVCTAGITHSSEPTYASTALLRLAVNQRSSFRWVAPPGFELRGPATANNGIGVKNKASSASLVMQTSLIFTE